MSRGKLIECNIEIEKMELPNKGFGYFEDRAICVKNSLIGQKLRVVCKKSRGAYKAVFAELIEKSPMEIMAKCEDFGLCGGCTYQNIKYEKELLLKETMAKTLLEENNIIIKNYLGTEGAPNEEEYRNKMEYSFGDFGINSPLALGMRKRISMYEVVTSKHCNIVDEDFRLILNKTLEFFQNTPESFYHKRTHEGTLRHLLVRKGYHTGQIMVGIVTTDEIKTNMAQYKDMICSLNFKGEIKSVFHIINNSVADTITPEKIHYLFGQDFIMDKLYDLDFKITPFSFFQTNTQGAEKLYSIVTNFMGENAKNKVVFDLFSGTGTIGQIVSKHAKKVVSVEIVAEAVEAAKENALLNKINNIDFYCGDVFEILNKIQDIPDYIILDPPRVGINQKTIEKILSYNTKDIIYVSCNPISLVEDLKVFIENGYTVEKLKFMDMFPRTTHVETVCCLQRVNS